MHKLLFSIATIGVLFCSAQAFAVSGTGHASATIKKALSVTEAAQMNFATIQTPTTGGTVTISPAGAVSTAATGFTFSGSPVAGSFTITGDKSTSLTVSFQNGSLTGTGTAMNLQNFTTSPTGASITTDSSGNLTLNVGADLVVGSSQTSGSYAGTYQITVSY